MYSQTPWVRVLQLPFFTFLLSPRTGWIPIKLLFYCYRNIFEYRDNLVKISWNIVIMLFLLSHRPTLISVSMCSSTLLQQKNLSFLTDACFEGVGCWSTEEGPSRTSWRWNKLVGRCSDAFLSLPRSRTESCIGCQGDGIQAGVALFRCHVHGQDSPQGIYRYDGGGHDNQSLTYSLYKALSGSCDFPTCFSRGNMGWLGETHLRDEEQWEW